MALINGTTGNDVLNGTLGSDEMNGLAGNDKLFGDRGSDLLYGGAGKDTLRGDVGDDLLDGGTGADNMNGGDGNDTYFVDNVGDVAKESFDDFEAGFFDSVQSSVTHTLGFGIEHLNLTGIVAINGTGNALDNSINGNAANNVLKGGGGSDFMDGSGGNDQLYGGAGFDSLFGGDGNDRLNGEAESDSLFGGDGNDRLDGGSGADFMSGDWGNDTYIVDDIGDSVSEFFGSGADTVRASVTHSLGFEVEHLVLTGSAAINGTGNEKNNVITGNSAKNLLDGGDGNDRLIGGSGNDQLNGGLGNDRLQGDSGNDTLNGGDGLDTADYSTATAGVTVDLDVGDGQSTGSGVDTLMDIESFTGSRFNDTFYAKWHWDGTIRGEAGNDTLTIERGSNVTVDGGAGNDILNGWESYGTLNGGAGNDQLSVITGEFTLNGGTGNDKLVAEFSSATLNGGAGADTLVHSPIPFGQDDSTLTFKYTSVNDTPSGSGRDTIIGFSGKGVAVGDKIDLSAIDANTLVSGNQAFTYIGNATFTAAGQLRYNGDILSGSIDADAASEFQIQLVGTPALVIGGAGTDVLL